MQGALLGQSSCWETSVTLILHQESKSRHSSCGDTGSLLESRRGISVQRGWEVELVYGMAQNTVRVGERSVSREQNVRSAVGESVRLVSILILEGWLPGVQPPRDGPSFGSAACALEVLWSCGYSDCDACLCHVTSPPPSR